MQIHITTKFCSFVLFVAFSFNCSTVNTTSLTNKSEIKTLATPIPANSPEIHQARFIKSDGWEIPLPAKREKTKVIERMVESEDGKMVKRTLTIYNVTNDFFFNRAPFSKDSEVTTGLLKLKTIYELKVKDKIYGYTIYAQKTTPDKLTGKPTPIGRTFFYQCFDSDGDGKFETLVTDTSGMKVPAWTSQ